MEYIEDLIKRLDINDKESNILKNDILNRKKGRKCININCGKEASHNYKNEIKRLYCGSCKLHDMKNVKHKQCIKCTNKFPIFNYLGLAPLYCEDCKDPKMVDTFNKKCIKCNEKRASFNYKKLKPLYCGECKSIDMIDLVNKKCIKCNDKIPFFNYLGSPPLYCRDCKNIDMVDTKTKKCIKCNKNRATCNYQNNIPLYCNNCKIIDMEILYRKKCIKCNDKIPNFNYSDEKEALYCKGCKISGMLDIKHKKCKTYLCDIRQSNKFEGYCLRCFIHNFPESKIIRDYGTREAKVTEFIKQEFKELDINYNKQIEGGCSKNRPDIFIDCLTHSIIIEVDEHQHKNRSYTPECEIQRVNNLFTDLADRPIIFIRFNLDSYKNKSGKLIKSCFECAEDRGLPKANKTLQARLKKLKKEIEKNIKLIPNTNITTIKLFYDVK